MRVWLDGSERDLDPRDRIGVGGEAEVFSLGPERVLKLFKRETHPDFAGWPAQGRAAEERLREHQAKLAAFPRGLPPQVIAPQGLARASRQGPIVGYAMRRVEPALPLAAYGDPALRAGRIDAATVTRALLELHDALAALHQCGVVVGDLNDRNVLVQDDRVALIDADSLQFGPYLCRLFTESFVDPLLCDPGAERPVLRQAYGPEADWYAYCVALFRCLLLTGPYGGVYKPADPKAQVAPARRPLLRLSVLRPGVTYPLAANPPEVLPDALLSHLAQVLHEDLRTPFPRALLAGLRWSRCGTCGTEHAGGGCPRCGLRRPPLVLARRAGALQASVVLQLAQGVLLDLAQGSRGLRWLALGPEGVVDEAGRVRLAGQPDPHTRLRLAAGGLLLARGTTLAFLEGEREPWRREVETCEGEPVVAGNRRRLYWVEQGRLMRTGPLGPVQLGEVLSGRSRIWAGERFGLGLCRGGGLCSAVLFDAERPGLLDGLDLGPLPQVWTHTDCSLSEELAWLAVRGRDGASERLVLLALDARGQLRGRLDAALTDCPWAAGLAGALALGEALLLPTDEGLLRLGLDGRGGLRLERSFPETQGLLDASSLLRLGRGGVLVQRGRECLALRPGP